LLVTAAAIVGSRLIGTGGATGTTLAARLRAAVGLPPVTAAQDLAPGVPGLSPILTPTRDFYRIDTALRLPVIDRDRWRLRIHGLVEEEVELDLDGLVALGLVEHDVTLSCVSNEVGGDLVGTARWTGVPLVDVLALARPLPEATQLVGRSDDGWTAGFPTGLAATPGALVAVGMNGEELPRQHGWPARLVVPGLYGYVSATKWLTEIELTTWEGFDAFWIERRWAKEGPIKLASRVDVPPFGTPIRAGTVRAAGVAWGPDRGISRVEVRVDEGPWRDAMLSDPLGTSTWVQWVVDVEVPEGRHDIQVRAYDGDGVRQSPGPAPVLPDGAEGWYRRSVRADA
jgi:DMSO/TMAO reductase YedYZ molybdopterin-dependent catalytic subunit